MTADDEPLPDLARDEVHIDVDGARFDILGLSLLAQQPYGFVVIDPNRIVAGHKPAKNKAASKARYKTASDSRLATR